MNFLSMVKSFFALLMLFCLSACSSQKTIINGLDERDANEIIVFLASKGIDAQKIRAKSEGPGGGGVAMYDVAVDSRVATEAMAILNANGLPRRKTSKLLEIFSAGGLVPSEMQEKIRYQAGLADQVASTIRKIDGILDADVQLSFPEEDPLNPAKTLGKVTASVFVKHNGVLDDPNSHLVTKIRRLVASSVQGLDFDNVTVIADRARFSSTQGSEAISQQPSVELIRVWGVAVAKDSVTRFQLIFTLSLLMIVLGLALFSFFVWRMMPLIREEGILPALFSLKSFSLEKETSPKETEEESKKKEEAEGKKTPPPTRENVE